MVCLIEWEIALVILSYILRCSGFSVSTKEASCASVEMSPTLLISSKSFITWSSALTSSDSTSSGSESSPSSSICCIFLVTLWSIFCLEETIFCFKSWYAFIWGISFKLCWNASW